MALAAAAAGVLFAAGAFPQQPLRRWIENRLKASLGPESRIGGLHIVPGRLQAELRDAVVVGPSFRLELPRVRVRLSPSMLWGGPLALRALELESPRVVLVAGDSGGAAGTPGPIRVESVTIADGALVYQDPALGGDVALHGISGSGGIGQGSLELAARGGEWRRPRPVPLGGLQTRLSVSPLLEVQLHSFEAGTAASRLRLSGELGPLARPELDLSFDADLDLADARFFDLADVGGRVGATGRVSGAPAAARIEARIAAGDVLAGPWRAERFEAQLKGAANDTVHFEALLRAAGDDPLGGASGVRASASGWVRPLEQRSGVAWKASLERRVRRTPRGPGTLSLTAQGRASGWSVPTIEGTASGRAVSWSAGGPLTLPFDAAFAVEGPRIRADLRSTGAPGALRASLHAAGSAIERLAVHGQGIDLQPFISGTGEADLDVELRGSLDRPSGTASARIRDLVFEQARLGDVELGLGLRQGTGRLELAAPALGVTGDAELSLERHGRLRGSLELERTPLAPFGGMLPASASGPRLEGELDAVVAFDTPLDRPAAADIEARVSRANLQRAGWSARLEPFTLRVEGGTAQLEDFALEANGARVEAAGRIGRPPAPSELAARLEADLASFPLEGAWRLHGRASGQVQLTGSITQPQIAGSFDLSGIDLGHGSDAVLLRVSEGRVDLERDRITWNGMTAEVAGGQLTSTGELPLASLVARLRRQPDRLAANEEARLEARWQHVQLGALLAALQPRRRELLEAPLAGELRLSGGLASPAEVQGALALEAIAGKAAGMEIAIDPVAVEIEGGAVTLPALTVRSGGHALTGTARVDVPRGEIEASARGRLDLRALAPLLPATSLAGTAELSLNASGPLTAPRTDGKVLLADVSVRSAEFPQALTGLGGTLTLEPAILRVERLAGRLGGGTLEVSGTAKPQGMALSDVALKLIAREIALQYPGEFKSRVSADLGLQGSSAALRVDGELRVERGLYDTDIFLEEAFLAPAAPPIQPSPLLRSVALNLDVLTERRIVVRNNLGDLAVTGRLKVRGDLAEPAPFGRLEIAEGGTIFLQTRKFTVRSGSLSYEGTLEPTLSIRAETGIREPGAEEVAVTVAADGPLMKPDLKLTSDPAYSEREIASLIATGRRNVALDSSAWVAGEQTAALLAGRLTRNLARGFMDLGLDEVDIQPELLARETDPGARFTFGKQLTPRVKVVYSYGLNDPEATFYQGEYRFRVGAEANARVQRDQGGIYTYGVGQRFRWGAAVPRRTGPRKKGVRSIDTLQFSGDAPLPEAELRRLIDVKPGDSVSPWDLLDDAERLEEGLRAAGHIEAFASARLEEDTAIFDVRAGPRYRWEVSGLSNPPDLSKLVEDARFESEAVEAGRRRLLDEARNRGHARATVEVVPRGHDAERTLVFHVDLGPRLGLGDVSFPGAEALSSRRLVGVAGGAGEILAAPEKAREKILAEYRREHFLTAAVGEPVVSESADGLRLDISVPVQEGPRARIAAVRFQGASPPDSVLLPLTRLEPGTPYDAEQAQQAVQWIRDWYLKGGFAVARVTPRLVPAGADLELVFDVDEGEATTIGEVVVTGLRRTRESLVRSRIDFSAGDPLDPRRLVVLERRLLELGTFSRAQVTASQESPATVRVELQERGPYAAAYDIRFSTEERATGVLDAEVGNLGGMGITLGGRYRQGARIREARGSLVLPAVAAVRGLTLSLVQREEDFNLISERLVEGPPPPPLADTERQRGFDLQHAVKLRDRWELLYGYRFRRIGSLASAFSQDVSSLQGSLVWDTRDDPLDPRRGHLWSLSLDVAPKLLASDIAFIRGFGQVFITHPVGESWTWAQGYRLGLANGVRENVLEQVRLFGRSTELFRAGGAGSLRGYATDSVGPRGAVPGLSVGGEAVLILNQELRYRHASGLGAAVFYDAGNVFEDVSDLGPRLRHSVGAGLRYVSPVGLLRLDVGFPLGRRAGDRPYQWFVSLGQAF